MECQCLELAESSWRPYDPSIGVYTQQVFAMG
jgi:hypothetical protein